jgi:holo-[acyl-carrier protein] synthase
VILGIGTDLVEIHRIEKALSRFGERFAERILVAHELERFRRNRKPAAWLAKRFAAKEAFSKAMGTGIHFPVNWHNVSVDNAGSGKPFLRFSAPLEALMSQRGIVQAHVSLTDELTLASAFVILEGSDRPSAGMP